MTTYNRRIYRIDKINYNLSPEDSFTKKNDEKVRFMDYYKKVYDINI